jgi:magnesium-dependent phosphatase 1
MRGEGVTGVYSGNRVIRMFPGALIALLEVHDGVHEGLMVAVASSADTPR